jgi:hypothetical protein
MHHVAPQNASDVKLSATGKEIVLYIPIGVGLLNGRRGILLEHIPVHRVSAAAIKTNASGMLSNQCMWGPFLSLSP